MIILAIIALIVIPPDKLPGAARQLAQFVNDLKRSTAGIWDDLKQDAMLKPEDMLKPDSKPNHEATNPDLSEKKPHE